MKTNIHVQEITDKLKKNNEPYKSYKTDKGTFNLFDQKLFDKITIGSSYTIDYTTNGSYKNITAILDDRQFEDLPYKLKVEQEEQFLQQIIKHITSYDPKIKIKQTSKGFHYYEVSSPSELLVETVERAKQLCDALNQDLPTNNGIVSDSSL